MSAGRCALVALAMAGCGHNAKTSPETPWSRVEVFRKGAVSIPPGWSVLVTEGPRFDLYSPARQLAVYVIRVDPAGVSAALRVARGIGAPSELALVERSDGAFYGEVKIAADRLFAACAADERAGNPVTVLAVARLVDVESVERRPYEAAGGADTLCRIASSIRISR